MKKQGLALALVRVFGAVVLVLVQGFMLLILALWWAIKRH